MRYDAIKADRASSTGYRTSLAGQYNGRLYRCECGATGCRQKSSPPCREQIFDVHFKYVRCGAVTGHENPLNFVHRVGA